MRKIKQKPGAFCLGVFLGKIIENSNESKNNSLFGRLNKKCVFKQEWNEETKIRALCAFW